MQRWSRRSQEGDMLPLHGVVEAIGDSWERIDARNHRH
jgi:hypothetical protein